MKKRTLKRNLPKHETGATVGNISSGMGAVGMVTPIIEGLIPDKQYTDSEGNSLGSRKSVGESALSYGATGATLGSFAGPVGTIVGGALGAGYGAVKGWMDKNKMDKAQEEANFNIKNRKLYRQMNTNVNRGNSGVNNSQKMQFADGGMYLNQDDPNANAELELQETFQLPDGTVGNVDGPSHESGGIQVDLPEGTRIWSDKLKHNGRTFAKHTKPITSKIAKLEKQIEENPVNSDAKKNTVMLLNKQLDHYFDVQETNKETNEMKRTFKKGGMIKYDGGGKVNPYDPFNQADLYNQWETQNQSIGRNTLAPVVNPTVNAKNIFAQGTINPENPSARTTLGVKPNINSYRSFYENTPNLPKGVSNEELKAAGFGNPYETPTPGTMGKIGNWFANNKGLVGQLGTAALSAGIQSDRVNSLARPRTLGQVRLSDKVVNPNLVDYSAERNAIDRAALTGMGEAQRGFGSSAATQAFKNKARLNQLEGTGRSFQAQSNTNTQIKNQYLAAQQEAAMKEAMMNNEIDKYNLENIYGFDTMKAGQKNAITAMLANTAGQAFGKQTEYANQLDQANILVNQYDPSVINDMIKNGKLKMIDGKYVRARNGGTIRKRSFKK